MTRTLSAALLAVIPLTTSLVVAGANETQDSVRPAVMHLGSANLQGMVDALAAAAAQQPGRQIPGRPLGRDSGFAGFVLRRDVSSRPEVHEHVAEMIVIQSGSTVIVSGGRVDGGALMEAGEWNGGRIVPDAPVASGATGRAVDRRPAGPGDIVVIPAGVPHQFEVAAGGFVTYVVLKIPAELHASRDQRRRIRSCPLIRGRRSRF